MYYEKFENVSVKPEDMGSLDEIRKLPLTGDVELCEAQKSEGAYL